MRRVKTPEQLKQWRKDNCGLTHIGLYRERRWVLQQEECDRFGRTLYGFDYDEVTRNEFLHRDAA